MTRPTIHWWPIFRFLRQNESALPAASIEAIALQPLRSVEYAVNMKFAFRPSKHGVAQVLGELESRVIRAVWENPDSSAREVLVRLSGRKNLAYTTIVTVLDRLYKKGLLKRRKEGRAFLYRPGLNREEFNRMVTHDVLAGLLEERSRPTLATFVELVATDEELLDKLEELVKQRKR